MRRLYVGLALLAAPSGLQAQDSTAAPLAVVRRLFDGMRAGDSSAIRSTFHPDARLFTTGSKDGQPLLRSEPIDNFVKAIGTPHDQVYDERLSNIRVEMDGGLASVWADYHFYLGDTFSHCGVDAFQIALGPDGWKIVALADTRRKDGCGVGGQ